MKTKLIIGLLFLSLIVVPLFALACEEEVTPPAQQEEEEQPPAEQEEEEGDWWDKFGTPQYGETLTIRIPFIKAGDLDPAHSPVPGIFAGGFGANNWGENLCFFDWTLDRDIWPYTFGFMSPEYAKGTIAESWEQTDPTTITIYLREGVHWQNRPPVNGRELTADDIVFNIDRLLGTGSGYTEPNPFYASNYSTIDKAVAIDTHTVQFQLNKPGVTGLYELLLCEYQFVPPEWVEQADPTDPLGVIGTSPWILTDLVDGTSMTLSANPDYYGYDERYPENQLPYIDTIEYLAIPDEAASLAAMRSGQVDMWAAPMGCITWQSAEALIGTNPDINMFAAPGPAASLFFRCDAEPFTDINVRKALNMAIDRQGIAQSYYGGYVDGDPVGLIGSAMQGWTTPYDEWPEELKAVYTYDVEGAKALLAQTDWPDGFDTNAVSASDQDPDLLVLIQSMLAEIGVNMDINQMDSPTYSAFTSAGQHDQMVFNNGKIGYVVSPTISLSYLTSAQIPHMNNTFNYDSEYDALFAQLMAATDTAELQRLSRELDLYALEQFWFISIMSRPVIIVWQPWVKGYSGETVADASWNGGILARLWIDQSLK
jgi:peptide/nickel transport system substrate-binding protein